MMFVVSSDTSESAGYIAQYNSGDTSSPVIYIQIGHAPVYWDKKGGNILINQLSWFKCLLIDKSQVIVCGRVTRLLMEWTRYCSLKTEVFVSCSRALRTLPPSSGMWFSLDSSGNPASWMLSQSLPTSLSYILHFLISLSLFFFCIFSITSFHCATGKKLGTMTGPSSPVDWQKFNHCHFQPMAAILSLSVHGCC